MRTTRREFTLASAGGLLGAMAGSNLLARPLAAAARDGHLPWYRSIRRIGQTNLNERDPEHGNVEQWADFWASAKVDAVALSVSGPVAFYPTDIPFFQRSRYLNGRDLFGECVMAAKARGLRVFGRMSPDIQWVDPALIAAHPLWLRHNQDGSLQYSAPDIAFTCQLSEHFTEQQPKILRELNARYDIDGVYMNGWPTPQTCYCATCRAVGDPGSPAYRLAIEKRALELIATYKAIVLEKNPDSFYSCNLGGGLNVGNVTWQLTRDALWYTGDAQTRSGPDSPVWQDSLDTKFARALMGDRPYAIVTASYGRSASANWRQAVDTSMEPICRMAQTAASGGIVWHHSLGMQQSFTEDRRWQGPAKAFMAWHAKNDRHFHNKRSLARVAILAAPGSIQRYKAPEGNKGSIALDGIYKVLIEQRVAFDLVHENDLTAARLEQYDLIILPNVALMSDAQAASLQQFVRGGGSMLATFETGLYNEDGMARADFALGNLFGIRRAGERQKSPPSEFYRMQSMHLQSLQRRHPLNAGFEDTSWIAGPLWRIPLQSVTAPVATFIKPYPSYPTEAVFSTEAPTDSPTVIVRGIGRSRLVYFAGDHDATYAQTDMLDLGQQLGNAVKWLLGETPALTVAGEGLMEITAWETDAGFALHLLNYNGPNAFHGRMRSPTSLGPQSVTMALPDGVQLRGVHLLHADRKIDFVQRGRMLTFIVPSVDLYEVAALET